MLLRYSEGALAVHSTLLDDKGLLPLTFQGVADAIIVPYVSSERLAAVVVLCSPNSPICKQGLFSVSLAVLFIIIFL